MKLNLQCLRANYHFTPYVLNTNTANEELSFILSDTDEKILFSGGQATYIEIICSINAHSNFKPATVRANYRNELGDPFKTMQFNLYDGSSIDMNGLVSSIDIIVYESEMPIDQKVIYTKKFHTSQSKVIAVHENENYSGIDTISDVYFLSGAYKPNMPLDNIQPYLFYLTHQYNSLSNISIISATEFLNSKNTLMPDKNIKFEDLSTLYDDIVTGKIQIVLHDNIYKSVSAIKNTLTNSLFTLKFKRIN